MPVEPEQAAPVRSDSPFTRTINDVRVMLDKISGRLLGSNLDLSHEDLAFFGSKVWQIVASCRERRDEDSRKLGWSEFVGRSDARRLSEALATGIARSLVAAKARGRLRKPSVTSPSIL